MYRDRDPELPRLMELMPASGRMFVQLIRKPEQPQVIHAAFPLPWKRSRPVYINFDLLRQLPLPEQDLVVLQAVCWVSQVEWFKPNLYQGLVALGLLGTTVEMLQGDALGIIAGGGLTAIAVTQIRRKNRQSDALIEADRAAVRVASRRGYTQPEATEHLLKAIEHVAEIEGNRGLSVVELLRCQSLRVMLNP
jgi:hypothetical protein